MFGERNDSSLLVQRLKAETDLENQTRGIAAIIALARDILIACLVSAHLTAGYLIETPFKRLTEESFLILGWVSNWRPLEIFLYDWWPLARRRDLYRRLSTATVEPKPYPVATSGTITTNAS